MTLVAVLEVLEGRLDAFRAYESAAARVMARHGGRIERAVVVPPAPGGRLREVHVVTFPDAAAFEAYQRDPARAELEPLRASAVGRAELLSGEDGPAYPVAEHVATGGPAVLEGGCHCGAIGIAWTTSKAPADIEVRACSCTFCRSHGARTASDPDGHVRFVEREPGLMRRYQFATRSSDFLVCGRCGVFAGAVLTQNGRTLATVNVNALAERAAFTRVARPVHYADEPREVRIARRLERWGPAEVVRAADAGT